ncbi:MAG: PilZ domain-containing protein [Pararhodobacter sp.]
MKNYREYRYPCDLGVLVRSTGGNHKAALINVSASGARLSRIEGAQAGQVLRLEFSSGAEPVQAVVRWARDGMAGLRFQRPLSRDQVTRLRGTVSSARAPGWTGVHAGLRVIH